MHHIDPKNRTVSIRPSSLPTEVINAVKSNMTTRFMQEAKASKEARTATAALMSQARAPLRSLVERDPKALAAVQELKDIRHPFNLCAFA